MITFIKQRPGEAETYLAAQINEELKSGKKVLWFLSGGSSVKIAVDARNLIKDPLNLTVMLIDERYGPDNHPDSNWRQIKAAGFDFGGLQSLPVLKGMPIEETTTRFQEELSNQIKLADFKIGLLGIGDDGHTAGILPGSEALNAPGLAAHYQGPDYQRITATPKALDLLDEAVVSLTGDNKRWLVTELKQERPPQEMPAQLLKKLPRFIVFNDWIGDTI